MGVGGLLVAGLGASTAVIVFGLFATSAYKKGHSANNEFPEPQGNFVPQ